MVFGGYFRQNIPIVYHGSRNEVVSQCINRSSLWNCVTVMTLQKNMRVEEALSSNNNTLAESLYLFSRCLLDIGNGNIPYKSTYAHRKNVWISMDLIESPCNMIIPGNNVENLLRSIYPELYTCPPSVTNNTFINSAIVTTKNSDVSAVNSILLKRFIGDTIKYLSADKVADDNQELTIPVEFLNSIESGSLPPHSLQLKIGVPVMLLRNISPQQGLCNGTRLIIKSMLPNIIEAMIITGSHIGDVVLIPRIKVFTNDDMAIPVNFSRCQFPLRLAFGMTINKAQGQTLHRVGLYLPSPVFSHGQLYVAMSRVKTPGSIKILVVHTNNKIAGNTVEYTTLTRNPVYP